jgi:uncharacterized protein (DUF1697 family)
VATLIALIRGINVGPSKRVAMADLRDLLAGLGYSDIRTHLQSGNSVFSTGTKPAAVAAEIEEALADTVGVRASVVVRTGPQLTAAMAADPLPDIADNGSRHFLGFLSAAPDPAKVAAIPELGDAADTAPDVVRLVGDHLYLWCPNGILKATFSKVDWDRELGVVVTMRNWNTATKLAELAGA